jgi:hypothetical protein
MNKYVWILLFLVFANTLPAQTKKERKAARNEKINALIKQEEEGVLIYKKHLILGFGFTTDGYGAFFEKGIKQDKKKTTLLRVELYEKKHPREERFSNQGALGNINSFVFGKLNNFYQFRLGYGMQYLIGSKGNKNGIEVSAVGVGGLSLGIAKPYFYDVADNAGNRKRVTFGSADTTKYNISGASGFTYGWNQAKIKPGAFLKAGLRFDYGRFNEIVSAVDIGLSFEFYASKIPQVYLAKERQFFFGAYLSVLIGRRK